MLNETGAFVPTFADAEQGHLLLARGSQAAFEVPDARGCLARAAIEEELPEASEA